MELLSLKELSIILLMLFSVVIIQTVLLLMQNYLEERDKIFLFMIAVFVGISSMFKVYGGMILIGEDW